MSFSPSFRMLDSPSVRRNCSSHRIPSTSSVTTFPTIATVLMIQKINIIKRWTLPTTKEGFLKFAGFVNYLRNFIPNASGLLAPFYGLLDKDRYPVFPTTDVITTATSTQFTEIKHWITKSLSLKLFDPQGPTIIYSDASLLGASSILFQPELRKGKPLFYPIVFHSLDSLPHSKTILLWSVSFSPFLAPLKSLVFLLGPSIAALNTNGTNTTYIKSNDRGA